MPSDDRPDYRAAQNAHARKIELERDLMQVTGLTRTQIRAAGRLNAFARTVNQARPAPAPVPQAAPQAVRSETQLGGSGLQQKGRENGNIQNAPFGTKLTIVVGVKVDDEFIAKEVDLNVLAERDIE